MDFLKKLLISVLLLLLMVVVIIAIALGLEWVLQIIPCDIMVYIETGLLLGLIMLLVPSKVDSKTTNPSSPNPPKRTTNPSSPNPPKG